MGGFGSGRDEYATTPTVEGCRHLDVDRIKEFTEQPGSKGPVWWGTRENPDATIAVAAEGERTLEDDEARAAALRLTYTLNPGTEESEDVEYQVPLEYTPCNYGGYRPWFRCPGVVNGAACNRRCRKLYLPHRRWVQYYLCRECYGLGYTSSRTSGDDLKQAELRYRRAFAKADAQNRRPHPNSDTVPWFPERPKGMHHDTYEELLEDVRRARYEYEDAWMATLRQMVGAVGVDVPDLEVS